VRSLQEALDSYTGLLSAETYAKATEQDSSIPADLFQHFSGKNGKKVNRDAKPKFPENSRKFALGLHLVFVHITLLEKLLGNPSQVNKQFGGGA
jgi:hypothetical protein